MEVDSAGIYYTPHIQERSDILFLLHFFFPGVLLLVLSLLYLLGIHRICCTAPTASVVS